MSEPSQMNNPDASAIVPLKRKRGRPRKHPRPDPDRVRRARGSRGQNPYHLERSHGAPGFSGINRSNQHQVNPVINASDFMVGQAVHGVIEASFDAGYLLTVRVGNSPTVLRGVVFKPGHFVPVNADIDIAPSVQMIRRNPIPLPRENYAQVLHNSQPRERNGPIHTARASNPVPSKGKQVPSVANENAPGILRGNLVPVVLQPVNLPNGAVVGSTSSNIAMPAQAVSSKGKQVLDTADSSNASTPTNQNRAVETGFIHFQSLRNHQEMPSSIQLKASAHQNSAETLQEAEAKGMPFEKLLTEIIKRNQVPAQSTGANTSSVVKLSDDDSATASEDIDDEDDDEEEDDDGTEDDALSVEPLRTVQPNIHNQPAAFGSRPMEDFRTGKMTELLQVLQENMTENSASQVQSSAADPRPKSNHLAEHRDTDWSLK